MVKRCRRPLRTGDVRLADLGHPRRLGAAQRALAQDADDPVARSAFIELGVGIGEAHAAEGTSLPRDQSAIVVHRQFASFRRLILSWISSIVRPRRLDAASDYLCEPIRRSRDVVELHRIDDRTLRRCQMLRSGSTEPRARTAAAPIPGARPPFAADLRATGATAPRLGTAETLSVPIQDTRRACISCHITRQYGPHGACMVWVTGRESEPVAVARIVFPAVLDCCPIRRHPPDDRHARQPAPPPRSRPPAATAPARAGPSPRKARPAPRATRSSTASPPCTTWSSRTRPPPSWRR